MTYSYRRFLLPFLFSALAIGGGFTWWVMRDPEATAAPFAYVALGASDTVGVGADRPLSEGWVPLVHEGLPADTQLVNLGINGATLDEVVRFQLPVAVDARPRWVTLWPGINDLRARVPLHIFTENLNTILAELSQVARTNSTQVIVLNIPDLRLVPAFQAFDPTTLDATVRRWNGAIAEVVQRHGARLLDISGEGTTFELADHPEYVSGDGFHPSSAGYRRLAEIALTVINEQARVPSTGR